LFVCTGNTCRSPMAEAALRAELKRQKIAWFTVQSAGISAKEGDSISPYAAQALKEAKIPLSAKFRSRRFTEKMAKEAFLVVCMSDTQKNLLAPFGNVTSFRELCGREIPDPYGQEQEVYNATLNVFCACMPLIIEKYISKSGD
ncbi:MAG: hypothetical protein K2H43_02155, partial [Clostridia bacterium]|nr:hypothetical protein [Clostridia bacterium]